MKIESGKYYLVIADNLKVYTGVFIDEFEEQWVKLGSLYDLPEGEVIQADEPADFNNEDGCWRFRGSDEKTTYDFQATEDILLLL